MARDLRAANGFAIALIGFIAGLHLNYARLRSRLRAALAFGGAAVLISWAGMVAALLAAWHWWPLGGEVTTAERRVMAAVVATAVVGFSPTVTMAVIAESRARGRLVDLALAVSVIGEFAVLIGAPICLIAARSLFASHTGALPLVGDALWGIVGSLSFGAAVGAIFALYVRLIGRETTVVVIAMGVVLIGVGATLRFEPLLAGLAAGLVVQNVMPAAGDVLRDAIERGAMPILVIFFAAAGASIRVEALAAIGVAALVIFGLRVFLVRAGTLAGAAFAGDAANADDVRLLWRGLLSTAGVSIAFVAVVAAEFPSWGPSVEALVVAVIALSELAAPIAFRAALTQAGEIGPSGAGLVVVSNREPWMHVYRPDGKIEARPTPGGVSVALDALMRERGGVWIAHGAGSADRAVVDADDSIEVPPDAPAYRLRRLWLSPWEEEHYYAGFANSALWPLCHQAHVRPVFKAEDWDAYQSVNRRFARMAAVEAPPDSSVFLNDYHLALVARELRRRRPMLRVALFWHIPWPDEDRLRICPWRKEIVEGLLHNDLIAFQLPRDQRNFLQAVAVEVGASVSGETAYFENRAVRVVSIPIGADFDRITEILDDPELPASMARMQDELGLRDRIVGVGVDRLDYTKGIPERLAAIDRVLDERPDLRDRLVFVQIGVPSREEVPGYAELAAEVDEHVARVNEKHGGGRGDGPIRYVTKAYDLPQLVALYRLADFCIVSSLHVGMNLVAKEFVAARDDLDGVLILSELAGAAQELAEALIINPYDDRGFTAAIRRALEMPEWERRRRMQALRRRVAGRDVLAWASDILDRLERRKGLGFFSG
jgi:trehalose 6-phosphate synthase